MLAAPSDLAERIPAFSDAPPRIRSVAVLGGLMGALVFLSYCTSAAVGHMEWGRALMLGGLRFALIWGVAFAVRSGNRVTWCALMAVVAIRTWNALGYTWETAAVLVRDGVADHDQVITFGVISVAIWAVGGIMLWSLLSKEVRGYVFGARSKPARLS